MNILIYFPIPFKDFFHFFINGVFQTGKIGHNRAQRLLNLQTEEFENFKIFWCF